jgi:hypothetical protein
MADPPCAPLQKGGDSYMLQVAYLNRKLETHFFMYLISGQLHIKHLNLVNEFH